MKETGIIRPVDNLGRVVLPKELRRIFDIEGGRDKVEIYVDGNGIVLKKYAPSCIICGSAEDCVSLDNHRICRSCIEKLKAIPKE